MSQIIPLFKKKVEKEPKPETSGKAFEKFFIFTLSGKAFAVLAVEVAEVAAYSSLIEIPQNSEIISGVVNVRGNVIPILNLRKRLDLLEDYQVDNKTKVIYFKIKQDYLIGMIVDDINFRLVDGMILPQSDSNGSSDTENQVYMEEKDINNKFPVFSIESYIKPEEFDDIQKVLDSFWFELRFSY